MFKLWHVSSMDKKGVSSKPQRLSFSPYKNKFKASDYYYSTELPAFLPNSKASRPSPPANKQIKCIFQSSFKAVLKAFYNFYFS